jgi:hypothetical protein
VLFDEDERAALRATGYPGPFGIFTHQPLVWDTQTADELSYDNVVRPFREFRVVLVVRHPLDALVSSFMHSRFQQGNNPYQGSVADFMVDPVHGLDKLLKFHQLWDAFKRETEAFALWRYEDAKVDPRAQLDRLLKFIGESPIPRFVDEAVTFASFENMQVLERSDNVPRYKSSGVRIFATGDPRNPNAYHVRKGKIGGFREELGPELTERLLARLASEMPALYGYSQ